MSAVIQLPTLAKLVDDLRAARDMEAEAKALRLAAEEAILAHPQVTAELKDEGTTTIEKLVKVATGYSRSWDQAALAAAEKQIDPAYWPFKTEFAEDRKASRVIEERFPDLWAQLRGALTLKPKKPAVSLVD